MPVFFVEIRIWKKETTFYLSHRINNCKYDGRKQRNDCIWPSQW